MLRHLSFWIFLSALSISIFSIKAVAEPLLKDPLFQLGYDVMSPQKDIYTDRAELEATHYLDGKKPPQAMGAPAWRLVQWGSALSLANQNANSTQQKGKSWQVDGPLSSGQGIYKKFQVETDGSFILELNGLAEFSSDYYRRPESLYLTSLDYYWPHLLLAQNIQSKKLDQYQKIQFSVDARLLFDHPNLREGYQRDLHAARFPVTFAVRNTLSNNLFWLTLVIYDDRSPQSDFLCKKCTEKSNGETLCTIPTSLEAPGRWQCPFDGNRWSSVSEKKGTRKMLFRLPTAAITEDNIQTGQWAHYEVDLLPYIQAGIDTAHEHPLLKGFTRDLRFYDLRFFSLGWEMTGLNHAAISIKNLSLTGL